MITHMSSREFNQNTSGAKKAAAQGPVFITDRGKPSYVLLSVEEYQRLSGQQDDMIEKLGMPPGVEDIEFDPPRRRTLFKPVDLT